MIKDPADVQISTLIDQAEMLVADLKDTVTNMKRILAAAPVDTQGVKSDES